MTKRLIVLLSIVAVLAGLFFLGGGWDTASVAGHDHDHDHDHAHPHDHGDAVRWVRRPSQVLDDPAYQEPAEQPLVEILSQELFISGDAPFMAPRFSADGKYVIFTGESYRGIWVANRDGSGLTQVTDSNMAGWRPVTTREGELIYRTAEFHDNGDLTFSIHVYDFETGASKEIYSGTNEDIYPPWLSRDHDMLMVLRDGEIVPVPLREVPGALPLHERDEGIAYSDGGQVWYRHLSMNEPLSVSTDTQATGGEVASPCGNYVAYLSGNSESALIVDLRTGSEIDIGEGSNLAWSPDGSLLLYDVTSDDGRVILDSELFIIRPDGEDRQRVTFDGERAFMNPSWSPEGNSFVAEDAHTGEIFHFQVRVNNATQ